LFSGGEQGEPSSLICFVPFLSATLIYRFSDNFFKQNSVNNGLGVLSHKRSR